MDVFQAKTDLNKYTIKDDCVLGYCFNTNIEFIFDIDDYEKVSKHRWKENSNKYHPYICAKINGKWIYVHRLIMDAKQGEYVDHIDRNVLNNKKSNLRIVTNQQNSFNAKTTSINKSGYKGVYWSVRDKYWYSQIRIGKTIHLGSFHTIEDAIKARLKAELKYFGLDFAPQRDLFERFGIIDNISELSQT